MSRQTQGRTIQSPDLVEEFHEKELSRRRFIARAAGAGLASTVGLGCSTRRANPTGGDDDDSADDDDDATANDDDATANDDDATANDDDSTPEFEPSLVGLGSGDGLQSAVLAALAPTIVRDALAFIEAGDVVYLKVNSNSGDPYPYSTQPALIRLVGEWCWAQGAKRVIVGDRSFFGDPGTSGNLVANGIAEAADDIGAELIVFEDDGSMEWVAFPESAAMDWSGGFRFPLPVVQADHVINLPVVKTHFISTFTMGMKNLIGLVNPADRERPENLGQHSTANNRLYRQIAQINQQITPSATILDGWEAVVRGGPTIAGSPTGLEDSPRVMIVSTDRIAADVTGLAVLKEFAVASEAVHDWGVWQNPQIVEAVAAGLGISGPSQYDASGPTVEGLDLYLEHILG